MSSDPDPSIPTNSTAHALLQTARKAIPILPCTSIPATVSFYTKTLHFKGVLPEDPEQPLCSVSVGVHANANLYLLKYPAEETHTPGTVMIWLGTEALDQYYELLKKQEGEGEGGKVDIAEDIEDKPWGYRQFTVRDPDGNRITFFKFLEGTN
jgi:catechol 2,3-dioxygenase-like lactoylglutathione lyase family enzyme